MSTIDLVEAGRVAVFTALFQTPDDVLDHVPEGRNPPFQQIGAIDFDNEGTKEDPLLRIEVEVMSIYRGEDRSELIAMMGRARDALLLAPITSEHADIGDFRWLNGSASSAGPDGITYAGIQTFQFYAQPA